MLRGMKSISLYIHINRLKIGILGYLTVRNGEKVERIVCDNDSLNSDLTL